MQADTIEQGMIVSSCVEDIFFIIQKVTRRAIQSNNARGFDAVFKSVTRVLEGTVVPFVQKKIGFAFSTQELKEHRDNANVHC